MAWLCVSRSTLLRSSECGRTRSAPQRVVHFFSFTDPGAVLDARRQRLREARRVLPQTPASLVTPPLLWVASTFSRAVRQRRVLPTLRAGSRGPRHRPGEALGARAGPLSPERPQALRKSSPGSTKLDADQERILRCALEKVPRGGACGSRRSSAAPRGELGHDRGSPGHFCQFATSLRSPSDCRAGRRRSRAGSRR
jgi:hypothetical protein